MQKVVLYYPNNWRRYIGDLATEEDKHFNWFLCSKPYFDPKNGLFVIEVGRGTRFYEESTGKTFVIPLLGFTAGEGEAKGSSVEAEKAKIILLVNGNAKKVKKYNYQGFANLSACNLGANASDEFVICKEAEFHFLPGVLESSKKERLCPIIDFAKKNNSRIKKLVPDFPSPEEIDHVIEKFPCSTVCRILYEYIYEYLSKI